MKKPLIFLSIFLITFAAALPKSRLRRSILQDCAGSIGAELEKINYDAKELIKTCFVYDIDLLPIKEVKEYYVQLKNTPEYKFLKNVLDGTDFMNFVDKVKTTKAYKEFAAYVQKLNNFYEKQYNAWVDQIKKIRAKLDDIIDFNKEVIKTIINQNIGLLPLQEIQDYYEQIKNSPLYQILRNFLDGTDFKNYVHKVKNSKAYNQTEVNLQRLNNFYEEEYNSWLNKTKKAISEFSLKL